MDEVTAAQAARQAAYNAALAQSRTNDALCKKFADAAVAFVQHLNSSKQKMADATGDLEAQLKLVEEKLKTAESSESKRLPEIKSLSDAVEKAGILSNPHTLLSYKAVDVQWRQYLDFLARKKRTIEDEIQTKKWRGLTPQQMEEINKQFQQYDTDNSKTLDLAEFRACLYSLGNDVDTAACKKIMVKYGGTEKEMPYEAFKEFMISQLGDSDTKEEILAGFKQMNKGKESATPKNMEILSDADVKYVTDNAPRLKDGTYDYVALVNALFAR